MPYVTQSELEAVIPRDYIVEALDDDKDGQADEGVWDNVYAAVAAAIEGPLGQRYSVPFSNPFPAVVVEAARVLAAEALFLRRGRAGDHNPWTARADAVRKRLEAIAEGKAPLTAGATSVPGGGTVISEDSKLYDEAGRVMV